MGKASVSLQDSDFLSYLDRNIEKFSGLEREEEAAHRDEVMNTKRLLRVLQTGDHDLNSISSELSNIPSARDNKPLLLLQ